MPTAPLASRTRSRKARNMAKTTPEVAEPRFDETMTRLQEIVTQLEGGELSLEASLALFEEGVGLSRSAQGVLDGAQKRIDILLAVDANGVAKTTPFTADR